MRRLLVTLISSCFAVGLAGQSKPLIEWAEIPAGTFLMGSPESEPERNESEIQHQVILSAFKMSKHEITTGQFEAFVNATGYITDADKGTDGTKGSAVWVGQNLKIKTDVDWKCDEKGNLRPLSQYNQPVLHVSWNDAKAFASWMGCRLPTEAEWEYACRAGTTTPFNTGNSLLTSLANFNGTYPYPNNPTGIYRAKPMPVGSYEPNAFGLYDMHGNVSEWCNDWFGNYPSTPQTNPKGPSRGTQHVIRGGNFDSYAMSCRSAFRDYNSTNFRIYYLGFRIVSAK